MHGAWWSIACRCSIHYCCSSFVTQGMHSYQTTQPCFLAAGLAATAVAAAPGQMSCQSCPTCLPLAKRQWPIRKARQPLQLASLWSLLALLPSHHELHPELRQTLGAVAAASPVTATPKPTHHAAISCRQLLLLKGVSSAKATKASQSAATQSAKSSNKVQTGAGTVQQQREVMRSNLQQTKAATGQEQARIKNTIQQQLQPGKMLF